MTQIRKRGFSALASLVALGLLSMVVPAAEPGAAQVGAGATLSVLRGTVGVLQGGTTPVQPAPSGLNLGVGDQVSTLNAASAIITFFEGSEVEMGANATVVIREVTRQGARANITLENVVGASVHRVIAFTDPGSTYRVESGTAVGLVRGTVVGFHADPEGDVTAALESCGRRPDVLATESCLEFPRPGMFMRPGDKRTQNSRGNIIDDNFSVGTPLFNVVTVPATASDKAQGTENAGFQTGSRTVDQGTSQQPTEDERPAATPGVTTLTTAANSGSNALQVASQDGFRVGNAVRINPGGANQEDNIVAGFGSLILQAPLRNSHQPGETVRDLGPTAPTAGCVLSSFATTVAYDTFPISTGSGPLHITMRGTATSAGTLSDPFIVLYRGSFNVASPCSNVVGADDDSGVGFDSALAVNATGGDYVVVATSFANGQLGSYSLNVTSNGNGVLNTGGSLTSGDPTFQRPNPGSQSAAAIVTQGGSSEPGKKP